jgi:hypothetical protein
MDEFTSTIVGLKELDQKLTELKTTTGRRILKKALLDGGKVFRLAIAERAPERPDLPHGDALTPGALRRDIELRFGFDPQGLPAAIIEPGRYTRHVARWVEYGHRLVRGGYSKIDRGGNVRGPGKVLNRANVPAYPFIRPGYESARAAAVAAFVVSLRAGIEKAAKG